VVSDIGSATRAHYDRWSYDFETSLHAAMQLDGSLLGRALGSVKAGEVVVDAGCGTGLVSRLAAEQTPARVVLGVDLSLGSLRRAAERSRGVMLAQGDVLELPLRSDAADLVISRGVIMTTGAPERAFAELARVTRPHGRLVVRIYNRRHPYRWIYTIFGPPCRAIAALPGGKALLALLVLPVFLAVTEIGLLLLTGRFTRIAPRVGWNFFADQLLVPHNSFHAVEEVRAWGRAAGCGCQSARTLTLGQQIELLFVKGVGDPPAS
jgi:SAM-dependent methyltransferase